MPVIGSPLNGTVTGDVSPDVTFTITDNLDTVINYIVFVDGVSNKTGNTANGVQTIVTLTGFTEGKHLIVLQGSDDAGNAAITKSNIVIVDTIARESTI